MTYGLEKISTVSDCDTLLTSAQKKKQNMERRRRNSGESIDTFRKRLDRLSQESASVQSSLQAFVAAYELLPEGRDKADMKVRIKRLELRQAMLEKNAHTCNVGILLVKELKYNCLDSQISALDDYIMAVEYRRTTLSQFTRRTSHPSVLLRQPMVRLAARGGKDGLGDSSQVQIISFPEIDAKLVSLSGQINGEYGSSTNAGRVTSVYQSGR